MEYNYKKIGERIRLERKNLKMNQTELCSNIGVGRNSLVDFENGIKIPALDTLLVMCKLFNCDIGYLLCEYDCKYHRNADIQEETGLSEKSILNIKRQQSSKNLFNERTNTLNKFLEDDNISSLIEKGIRYKEMKLSNTTDSLALEALAYALYRDFISILEK